MDGTHIVKLIGDPHLGREFKNNVPLERRGEREEMMFKDFEHQLMCPDDLIICIGDLFDHWYIKPEYLKRTLHIILDWRWKNKNKHLIILQGNHDYSPTQGVYGAFDILTLALEPYDNIHVVRKTETICGIMCFPWQWDKSALEQLDDITLWTNTAVGHWDLVDYGGDTGHLCPSKQLQEHGVKRIISGHWHISGTYDVDGVEVWCTGSMQPMTHAEDPEGKMYVTLTAKDFEQADLSSFKDKYVRVLGERGRLDLTAPEGCLGFKVQTQQEDQKVEERVTLGDFDMDKILDKHLKAKEVPEPVSKKIKERLRDIA
jgi:DNA repair exonuclease SbcCD nuclease subunit